MNKSIMMGRLVRDPDIRYTEGENGELAIANFRLAVDRKYAKEDAEVRADFFRCTAFGRWAKFAEKYLFQGIKVVVQGRMQNDNYTNRDGDRVYGVCLMIDDIDFAESKSASEKIREENGVEDSRSSRNSRERQDTSSERSTKNSRTRGTERSSRDGRESTSRNSSRNSSKTSSSGRNNQKRNVDEEFQDMDEFDEDSCEFD